MSLDDLFEPDSLPYHALATSREAALARLSRFKADSAHFYRAYRNEDLGPSNRRNVSVLSAAIRRRLISETEVLAATLECHSPQAAEKFIQEVFWRGYFKGWLEHRPQVWDDYLSDLEQILTSAEFTSGELGETYHRVLAGRSGIDCMDAWVRELPATGYLHNHARMWFASIWIFTLDLPWQLGAWFFYQHLLDGDPASNTLSWRWVGGLHTVGKHYLARPDNINRYTQGRFNPGDRLVRDADPLPPDARPEPVAIEFCPPPPPGPCLLVLTEEDCCAEQWDMTSSPEFVAGVLPVNAGCGQLRSEAVLSAAGGAVTDAVRRASAHFGVDSATDLMTAGQLTAQAQRLNIRHIVTGHAAIGPTKNLLAECDNHCRAAGLSLHRYQRPFDQLVWPYARAGFFRLRKQIPRLLKELNHRFPSKLSRPL